MFRVFLFLHPVLLRKLHPLPERYMQSETGALHPRDVILLCWSQSEILCTFCRDLHRSECEILLPHGRWIYRYHEAVRHVLPCGHRILPLLRGDRKAVLPRSNALMHSVRSWNGISFFQGDGSAPDEVRVHRLPVRLPRLPREYSVLLLCGPFLPSLRCGPDGFFRLRSVFPEQFLPPHGGSDRMRKERLLPVYRRWSGQHLSWFRVYGCFVLHGRWCGLSFHRSEAVPRRWYSRIRDRQHISE